jgi:endonuclease G
MKLISLLFYATLAISCFANAQCEDKYYGSIKPIFINKALEQESELICYEFYEILHSGITKTPLWSAEHLTKNSVMQAAKLKRNNTFHPEEKLPEALRSELKDYIHSGYDRGHMSPSHDMPTITAQNESFSMANMIPQNPKNNQILWEGIEAATRTLAKSSNSIYVITGPAFIGSKLTRLNHRVFIPTHIFKAIYNEETGEAAAYLVKNSPDMSYDVVSINDLSKIIEIDVFPGLPSETKIKKSTLGKPTPHNEGH